MAKFFTKKVALIALAAVVAVSGVIWAIVANLDAKFKSRINTVPSAIYVSGNGTASVMVDDYLYFVGDSVTTSEIKYGDNEYYANGKMQDAGIFRVKIEDSKPVLDYEYDNKIVNDQGEKVELQPDDEGYNTNVVGINDWDNVGKKNNGIEAVVPKIAGHDQSAMWVFGETLIYTSPHNRYDNRGKLLSNYLDFFRVDLDGKNHSLIYTTSSADLTRDNFTVWADAIDNVYLLVHETEDSEIVKVNVADNTVSTIAEKVTDVVLPMATQYCLDNTNETLDKVYGGVMSYVYFSKSRTDVNEHDSNIIGNLLYRCAVKNGEPELIASDGSKQEGITFTPKAVTPLQNGNAQFVYSIVLKDLNDTKLDQQKLCVITNDNFNNYVYAEPEDIYTWGLADDATVKIYANGFCTVNDNLYHYDVDGANMIFDNKVLSSGVEKVLAVMGNAIYVQSGTTVTKVQPGQTNNSVSIVPAPESTEETEDAEAGAEGTDEGSEEEPTSTITLPVAILYQPHGSTGEPMILAQDADHIRLYTSNGKFSYLRLKGK